MKTLLYWLANNNFFSKPTIIRKWQCTIFGHEWFGMISYENGEKWCSWCGRHTGKYPKMRKRV